MILNRYSLNEILQEISEGYFVTPNFQREFKWTIKDITKLGESVLLNLPVGAITTWEVNDSLLVGPVSEIKIPVTKKEDTFVEFPISKNNSNSKIVVDGRQRLTAIACLFGGLRNDNSGHRWAGKYFLNLNNGKIEGSISFHKNNEIKNKKLDQKDTYLKSGLIPLSSNPFPLRRVLGNTISAHLQKIRSEIGQINPNSKWFPLLDLMISSTTGYCIAEMVISKSKSLSDIAQIFESLNRQGTPVDIVDIVHAYLNAWFKDKQKTDFLLRDWIDDFCDNSPSKGWGAEKNRKIIVEMSTASILRLDNKDVYITRDGQAVKNIQESDILSLGEGYWANLVINHQKLKDSIGDFQMCVLGNYFPEKDCPYSKSACVYIGLSYKEKIDTVSWKTSDLNTVFRTFFWANALTTRYTQDSFSMSDDLEAIENLLNSKNRAKNKTAWHKEINDWIKDEIIGMKQIVWKEIEEQIKGNVKVDGALEKAIRLPTRYLPKNDLFQTSADVSYGNDVHGHHVFPQAMRITSFSKKIFGRYYGAGSEDDKKKVKKNILSAANITPLLGGTNEIWSNKMPSVAIKENMKANDQQKGQSIWQERLISDAAYDALMNDEFEAFIDERAKTISQWLIDQIQI